MKKVSIECLRGTMARVDDEPTKLAVGKTYEVSEQDAKLLVQLKKARLVEPMSEEEKEAADAKAKEAADAKAKEEADAKALEEAKEKAAAGQSDKQTAAGAKDKQTAAKK